MSDASNKATQMFLEEMTAFLKYGAETLNTLHRRQIATANAATEMDVKEVIDGVMGNASLDDYEIFKRPCPDPGVGCAQQPAILGNARLIDYVEDAIYQAAIQHALHPDSVVSVDVMCSRAEVAIARRRRFFGLPDDTKD